MDNMRNKLTKLQLCDYLINLVLMPLEKGNSKLFIKYSKKWEKLRRRYAKT